MHLFTQASCEYKFVEYFELDKDTYMLKLCIMLAQQRSMYRRTWKYCIDM